MLYDLIVPLLQAIQANENVKRIHFLPHAVSRFAHMPQAYDVWKSVSQFKYCY